MKDQTFNGIDNAEEIFFVSKLDSQETIKRIRDEIDRRCSGGFIDISTGSDLKFTKRRLFFCEYYINCDITSNENRYRLRLYYDIRNTEWTYWVFGILYLLIVGYSKILAKGDETTNTIIGIIGLLIVIGVTGANVKSGPEEELQNNCKRIKREIAAYVKLELEP